MQSFDSDKNFFSLFVAEKIRVGKDYQVVCPELIPITDRKPETLNDRALLVWSPTIDIPESKCKSSIYPSHKKKNI